jgi:hypothetical protein
MAIFALIAILLPTATVTPASNSPAKPTGRATLIVVALQPVTLAGRGFKAAERVRVTVEGRRKSVTAGARGGFKVVFGQLSACNGFIAVARGSEGSRASVAFANFSNVHCLERQG